MRAGASRALSIMLKKRAFNATLWSGADIIIRQGLQFLVVIVLARILTPGEFGTVALLGLFTAVSGALVDSGFSAALIQRQDTDHTDESTVFWCNLGIGALAASVFLLIAPGVAGFYGLPVLDPLMRLMALNVFVGALGAIHVTLLRKRLQFRRQMLIGAAAALVSGSVAIIMALHGYGAWALAIQIVAMTSITTVLLWATGGWWPALTFSGASARKLFAFGSYYMAANLLDVAYSRLYTLVIGKLFGPRDLGYYGNADSTVQLPSGFLSGVFGRVVFPMFAATTSDPATLRRGKQFGVRAIMLINVPMMFGLAALAQPFVGTVFGERWLPAAPILQVLCMAALLTPLHMINIHALLAHGQSHLLFRIEIAKKSLGIALMVAGSQFGLLGIAWSQVVYSIVSFLLIARFTARFVDYSAGHQLRDALPALGIGLAMATGLVVADMHWDAAAPLKLVVLTAFGGSAFVLGAWLLRIAALQDVLTLFHKIERADGDCE
jgi:O-antigen/teichoic acid export membrane protein